MLMEMVRCGWIGPSFWVNISNARIEFGELSIFPFYSQSIYESSHVT
jgi:hypothetical protein